MFASRRRQGEKAEQDKWRESRTGDGLSEAESVGVSREGGDVEKEKMACVEREQSKRG